MAGEGRLMAGEGRLMAGEGRRVLAEVSEAGGQEGLHRVLLCFDEVAPSEIREKEWLYTIVFLLVHRKPRILCGNKYTFIYLFYLIIYVIILYCI